MAIIDTVLYGKKKYFKSFLTFSTSLSKMFHLNCLPVIPSQVFGRFLLFLANMM